MQCILKHKSSSAHDIQLFKTEEAAGIFGYCMSCIVQRF